MSRLQRAAGRSATCNLIIDATSVRSWSSSPVSSKIQAKVLRLRKMAASTAFPPLEQHAASSNMGSLQLLDRLQHLWL